MLLELCVPQRMMHNEGRRQYYSGSAPARDNVERVTSGLVDRKLI